MNSASRCPAPSLLSANQHPFSVLDKPQYEYFVLFLPQLVVEPLIWKILYNQIGSFSQFSDWKLKKNKPPPRKFGNCFWGTANLFWVSPLPRLLKPSWLHLDTIHPGADSTSSGRSETNPPPENPPCCTWKWGMFDPWKKEIPTEKPISLLDSSSSFSIRAGTLMGSTHHRLLARFHQPTADESTSHSLICC